MQANTLVSIIIPTYNRGSIIGLALNSVRSQTHPNWECIIVDDHSTDDTKEVVNSYTQRDQRFKYLLNQRKKGAQGARNTGILLAEGQFIQFLDSDDFISPYKIEKQILQFKSNPDLDMVFCLSEYFSRENNSITTLDLIWNQNQESKDYIYEFLMDNPVFHTNEPLWRSFFVKKLGFWNEDLICWQDWEYHLRALQMGAKHAYIKEVLAFIDDTPRKLNSVSMYVQNEKLNSRIISGDLVKSRFVEYNIFSKKYNSALAYHYALIALDAKGSDNKDIIRHLENRILKERSDFLIRSICIIITKLLDFRFLSPLIMIILRLQVKLLLGNHVNTWKKPKINSR